ncbi:hypothetical protein [Mycobacterium hubeiense]|uniref:hypothetical protein n=1 Tax=Mycobacterium hubeiense TaxID=1867256 RepID=UPI000C7EBB72|nr:hypothetical protein [Mycobacterium sp. QGD 101]
MEDEVVEPYRDPMVSPHHSASVLIYRGLDDSLAEWCRSHRDVVGELHKTDAAYRVLSALINQLVCHGDRDGLTALVLDLLADENKERAEGGWVDDGLNEAILSSIDQHSDGVRG